MKRSNPSGAVFRAQRKRWESEDRRLSGSLNAFPTPGVRFRVSVWYSCATATIIGRQCWHCNSRINIWCCSYYWHTASKPSTRSRALPIWVLIPIRINKYSWVTKLRQRLAFYRAIFGRTIHYRTILGLSTLPQKSFHSFLMQVFFHVLIISVTSSLPKRQVMGALLWNQRSPIKWLTAATFSVIGGFIQRRPLPHIVFAARSFNAIVAVHSVVFTAAVTKCICTPI